MNIKLRNFVFAVALALVWCIPSVGQVLKGSISGTVTDPQGAVIADAGVKAKNVETAVITPTTTDSSGLFRLVVDAGIYDVEISSPKFKTQQERAVAVAVGRESALGSIHLAIGQGSETIEVTAAAPLIEPTQSQVTNTFSGVQLQTFAGVQENQGLDNLALFVPGISGSRSNNFSNSNGAGGFTVDGIRGRNNDQQIDGQNNNDNSVGGPGLFLSNPEFVQQYVIVTNQFGPEYGRNAGSVVNEITKQGTNAWHGSVYGTENSNFLNALTNTQKRFGKDANGKPLTGPPRINEEFSGFSAGGPVVKNRVFLFGGFDSDLFSGSTIYNSGGSAITPNGLATMAACFPGSATLSEYAKFGAFGISAGNPRALNPHLINVTGCPGVEVSTVQRILPTPGHEFDWVVRNDVNLGSRDNITARYLFNRNNNFNANSGGTAAQGYPNNVPALSQVMLLAWTHNLTPRMVNEARVSFGRLNVVFGGNSFGSVPVAGQLDQAIANVTFNSAASLGFGPATNIPQSRLVNTWQGQDNWNYVLGKHAFKAGINWTYQRSPNIFLPNINGQYRFNDFGTFASDVPNRVSIAQGVSTLDFREYDTFAYAGDDWKITQSLTLNLGLTWSYYGQPANLFTDITTPRESNAGTAFWANTDRFGNPIPLVGAGRTFPSIAAPNNSYGPTLGFAYSPQWGGFLTGNGKTVIRGGYRMSYDPPFYNIYVNISSAAPVSFLDTFAGATANSKPLPSDPHGPAVRNSLNPFIQKGAFDARSFAQTTIPQDFGPDRVQSWSFGFERELSKNAAFEARYAGNKGDNLFQSVNANPFIGALAAVYPNLVPSGLTPCPAANAVVSTATGRVNCDEGVIRSRNNSGYSYYNGLQLEFRANNLFKQLTMRSGFTWSKTTDNVSEIFSTQTAGNSSAFAQNPLNITNGEYGISGLDFPRRWTVSLTEEVPFFKEQHGVVGHLLGGWTVAASYALGSGQGYTPSQVVEATLTGGDFYDNLFNGTFNGFETARPFLGNPSAPVNQVGIFCGDAVKVGSLFVNTPNCAVVGNNQLVSVNALNTNGGGTVAVTKDQVRFIENTGIAQQLFGTPFGNVGRNSVRDAITNVSNLSVYKKFKLGEHTAFEFHATAVNWLNHYNFSSVDPFLSDAGLIANGTGFGDPTTTSTLQNAFGYRKIFVGGKITF